MIKLLVAAPFVLYVAAVAGMEGASILEIMWKIAGDGRGPLKRWRR